MNGLLKVLAVLAAALVVCVGGFVFVAWAPDRPVSELKTRWATPPSEFLEIAGMEVHLRDEGPRDDQLPLVLLHGTSSSLHTWDGWTRALSGERRVVRVDLPGFGLTGPRSDDVYTIDSYVRFVIAVLDELGIGRCVLGGNSFGGEVSWAASLASPKRIVQLILVDSAGYRDEQNISRPIAFRVAATPILNRLMDFVLPRSMIVSSLRSVYGDPSKVTPELIDRYFDIAVREGNRGALVERYRQAPHGELAHRIPEITAPTLLIWGGRDRLFSTDVAKRFHGDIPGSELVIFEDLGHVPQEEDPERTVEPVRRFLGLRG